MKSFFDTPWWTNLAAKHRRTLWLAQTLLLLSAGIGIGLMIERSVASQSHGMAGDAHAAHEDAPRFWTCAMHPQIRRDRPGDCPICGMDLVPVQASGGGIRTIAVSPAARKLMNIETSLVERRFVTADVRMVGKVEYDETRLSHITAWVSGRLDRLFVDYAGIEVKQGDHLVSIYSEQLYTAQEELIQSLKHQRDRPPNETRLFQPLDLVASSREKLRLLGLTPQQIEEIEQRGSPVDHITIYSPIGGIVIQKMRQEGDRVQTGDRIYTVADLNHLWVKLDAYESDLAWIRYGQEAEFTTAAYPGETFSGRIAFIDPVLNKETRTVKVRVNVANEEGRLKPEMFVSGIVRSQVALGGRVLDASLAGKWISPMHPEIVKDEPGKCDICGMPLVRAETLGYVSSDPGKMAKPLVIPVTAALVTGTRAVVYVELPTAKLPTFEGREIVLGPRAGDYYLVRSGLKEGELVVTNGNFKLDSALQISAKPSMMTPEGGGGGGHVHGGGGGGGKKKSEEGGGTSDQMILPAPFRAQLDGVVLAFGQVTAAIEEGELAKIRATFNGLGQALGQVDQKLLTGHPQMLWREFSMLLSNDVVEGREVAHLQMADRIYETTRGHIERVCEQFGMLRGKHEHEPLVLDVPREFQTQLAPLWQAYLPIGQALAADQFPAAQQAIAGLKPALASIDPTLLQGNAAAAWQKEHANLTKIIAELAAATDIKATRAAFALLSDEMLVLAKSFGIADAGPIYELHCPMAFEGRGAGWLQNNDQARNPYYGATMLKCADRIVPIAPRDLAEPATSGHEEHKQQ